MPSSKVIDINRETIIPLSDAGKYCPGPRKPHRSTGFRWWRDGLLVQDSNDRVKLQTVKLDGIRCTSVEAVWRFLREANGQEDVPGITPKQRQRQAETAGRLCAEKGF